MYLHISENRKNLRLLFTEILFMKKGKNVQMFRKKPLHPSSERTALFPRNKSILNKNMRVPTYICANKFQTFFDVLLTVHLSIFILIINQLVSSHL